MLSSWQRPPKMGDEVLSTIGDNVGWGAMLCEDLWQEDAC